MTVSSLGTANTLRTTTPKPDPVYTVRFVKPAFWQLDSIKRPRWRWIGRGELTFDGGDTILRGRRPRTLWLSAKQEIRFASSTVRDVVVAGATLRCEVVQPGHKPEPLAVHMDNEASARRIAARWPSEQTELSREREGYRTALATSGARAVITPILFTVNLLVFIAMISRGIDAFSPAGAELIPWGSDYGPKTLHGEWWRLFTAMFLHVGLAHLAANMWVLAALGPLTERLFGSGRFLLLYVFSGVAGGMASLLWNPVVNSAGASGAIFGVLGGLLAFMSSPHTELPTSISRPRRNSALAFVAYSLYSGFGHPGINNAAHVGGLIAGAAIGLFLARPLRLDVRRDGRSGLVAGAIGGTLVLVAFGWLAAHPSVEKLAERNFREGMIIFATQDSAAIAAQNALVRQLQARTITSEHWAKHMLSDVVPLWQAANEAMDRLPLPGSSPLLPVKRAVADYLQSRLDFARVSSQAVTNNSFEMGQEARRIAGEAETKSKLASELIKAKL